MPRQPRIEFEGATYHVLARGNRKARIFIDEQDHLLFLKTLAQTCERAGFKVYAWVLMGNHYHLALSTPRGNLVEGMSWLQNTYTRRFNVRHHAWGRLFGDRYKSVLVDSQNQDGYLPTLIDYIHLNPARSGKVASRRNESILDYPWSSVTGCYALPETRRPEWMAATEGLAIMGYEDTLTGRRQLVQDLDDRIASEQSPKRCGLAHIKDQSLRNNLRRGWYWGSLEFKERLLKLLAEGEENQQDNKTENTTYRASVLGHAQTEDAASRLLAMGTRHFGLQSADAIKELSRGDSRRTAVAWALWRKTSISQKWIASAVGYRTAGNVSQQVRRYENGATEKSLEHQQWVATVNNL